MRPKALAPLHTGAVLLSHVIRRSDLSQNRHKSRSHFQAVFLRTHIVCLWYAESRMGWRTMMGRISGYAIEQQSELPSCRTRKRMYWLNGIVFT